MQTSALWELWELKMKNNGGSTELFFFFLHYQVYKQALHWRLLIFSAGEKSAVYIYKHRWLGKLKYLPYQDSLISNLLGKIQ